MSESTTPAPLLALVDQPSHDDAHQDGDPHLPSRTPARVLPFRPRLFPVRPQPLVTPWALDEPRD